MTLLSWLVISAVGLGALFVGFLYALFAQTAGSWNPVRLYRFITDKDGDWYV